jgi:hypothetical protein
MMPGGPATTSIREILMGVANFIGGKIMPILVALAILTFLVNIISFIASSGFESGRPLY